MEKGEQKGNMKSRRWFLCGGKMPFTLLKQKLRAVKARITTSYKLVHDTSD